MIERLTKVWIIIIAWIRKIRMYMSLYMSLYMNPGVCSQEAHNFIYNVFFADSERLSACFRGKSRIIPDSFCGLVWGERG